MRWREPVSTVSRSGFAAEPRDGCAIDNSMSKAMDAGIIPKEFVHLAAGYRSSLMLRESITTRRRKVIAIYTTKVRVEPIQGEG
jgi:hypothetical protein